jgi:hypothetical protein
MQQKGSSILGFLQQVRPWLNCRSIQNCWNGQRLKEKHNRVPLLAGIKVSTHSSLTTGRSLQVDPRGSQFHDAPVYCSSCQVHRIARLMGADTLLRVRSFIPLCGTTMTSADFCPLTPCVATWCAAFIGVGFGGKPTPFEMALSPTPVALQAATLDRSPRIRTFTLLNRVPSGKFNRVNFRYTTPL